MQEQQEIEGRRQGSILCVCASLENKGRPLEKVMRLLYYVEEIHTNAESG